ncbi:YafY family transcriptional regulator [Oscillospiraceae bacterium OttesenSCG-928-G22]|nr:YafY family transcriptional regulator [Oscillospiraceae bacterium OttesenSCG-928-G22]
MQIMRLFEIVYLLLSKGTATAAELADRFEVSTRTIYRDIDVLSGAGIPVYASKGRGGGIGLLPGFVLDKSLLTAGEQGEVMTALRGLAATGMAEADGALRKLGALFAQSAPDWIYVDFSDWGRQGQEQFETIKSAILTRHVLTFDYYNSAGERTARRVRPAQLWFKHRAWYVKAFCLTKNGPRLFKLSRMRGLKATNETFSETLPDVPFEQGAGTPPPIVTVTLRIDADNAYRVFDEFAGGEIEPLPDGGYQCRMEFVEDRWLYGYLLSFGAGAEILDPPRVRETVCVLLTKTLGKYL